VGVFIPRIKEGKEKEKAVNYSIQKEKEGKGGKKKKRTPNILRKVLNHRWVGGERCRRKDL